MLKTSQNTANPGRTGGGRCCSGKENSAEVAGAVKETVPASEPSDRAHGRDEEVASCCQSSKANPAKKQNRDAYRP